MKQSKQFFSLIGILLVTTSFAQVGINTGLPQASLDITAKNTTGSAPEGLIAPRLTGDQIKAADALYGNDQTGAFVYATAAVGTSSTKTARITTPGYYYFDGNIWQKFIVSGPTGSPILPHVVASGSATSNLFLTDSSTPGGGYRKATYTTIGINDGSWSTTNNNYTVGPGKAGFYLISTQAIETPNNGNNSFGWNVRKNDGTEFTVYQSMNVGANYNSGGTLTIYLNAGEIVEMGFEPCFGCFNGSGGFTSYTVTRRAFSITYLGS
ncbi:hypothetical protein [Chryseobacterium populi]|uniref:C1q domain-containing protein n=1 Tax=Chryseobacterium populi TaxID=1144316 RepID=J3CF71_9FLAO|nr:hypothetical protein [Chryseobacterium populi]EJL70449.1 hypothetical protein PMI13_02784 [Chryseobacterium populi]